MNFFTFPQANPPTTELTTPTAFTTKVFSLTTSLHLNNI